MRLSQLFASLPPNRTALSMGDLSQYEYFHIFDVEYITTRFGDYYAAKVRLLDQPDTYTLFCDQSRQIDAIEHYFATTPKDRRQAIGPVRVAHLNLYYQLADYPEGEERT